MPSGSSYIPYITDTATRYGIPPELAIAVAQRESGLNPNAISTKGAIGLFQLMPGTAKELGVDPYDPLQNIDGGIRYLSQQYNRFGSWDLALAGYNAGPGNVSKYGGIPPFKETKNYVTGILDTLGLNASVSIANSGRGSEYSYPFMTVVAKGGILKVAIVDLIQLASRTVGVAG